MHILMLKNRTTPLDPYLEIMEENGNSAEFLPLLHHAPVNVASTTAYLSSNEFLDEISTFIITSQRAVEVFHECLGQIEQKNSKTAERIRSKTGYTVGPATEKILLDNGFLDVRGGSQAGNGSKLADIITNDLKDSALPIVFFTGVIRRDVILVKLKANGFDVKEEVIYKTEPRSGILDDFHKCCQKHIDWIVFFSPQGTQEIVDHMKKSLQSRQLRIACIGPTTEEYLKSNGISPAVVAGKPTASSLFAGFLDHGHE
ncbi:CIC11C00000000627 [Sungouiella intermedia]|uniref:CIC11C00000000627 n=1 Tax=Sungouiella intermedia TaxID=45354 RepID=A0A1L0C458_9ASCO|nr:CIC11C00000000627 [[Candida] intermedia]